jgi:heptosyltransferase-2
VLATTATYGAAKGWPAARAAEFLRAAVAREGRRVILLGDGAAREATDQLRALGDLPWRREAAGGEGVVDLVGRTDLLAAAGWLRAAAVCVSIDSGLMHLAAALGTPTLGLFGSTSAAWTGPRGERTATLAAAGFPCQPCFRRRCNQEVFCMDSLSGEDVARAARELALSPAGGAVP